MNEDLSAEIEKAADGGTKTRASWTGILSINLPALNPGSVDYHLRAGKAKGDQQEVKVKHIDRVTKREVVSKEVARLYRYTEDGSTGKRSLPQEITYGEAKEKVRYAAGDGQDWKISVRTEKRFFDKELLDKGEWKEVPADQVVDVQDETQTVEPFDRTQRIEVTEDAFVPLERLAEYRVKDVYMLFANTDKKVNEDPKRISDLARMLLDKQVALVAFFSWGRGYNYFTAVIHPYERKDGKLWLLMSLSEGILLLDEAWAIQQYLTEQVVAPVPVAKKKPRVRISK